MLYKNAACMFLISWTCGFVHEIRHFNGFFSVQSSRWHQMAIQLMVQNSCSTVWMFLNPTNLPPGFLSDDSSINGVQHKHQPFHDKINKDCQVLFLGDSRFLQFFRVKTQVMKWQTPINSDSFPQVADQSHPLPVGDPEEPKAPKNKNCLSQMSTL